MLTHRAVLEQATGYASTIDFDRNAVVASWLPPYHDMGLIACFLLPMIVGAHIVHLDAFEWVGAPLKLLEEIDAHRATHVWLPNFAFSHLALARRQRRQGRWNLSSLKAVVNCSEPCKAHSMDAFTAAFSECGVRPATAQVCYAMAETVFAITQTTLGMPVPTLTASKAGLTGGVVRAPADAADEAPPMVSCGKPIANVRLKIVDDAGTELPELMIGEICAAGPSLYDGYHRLPELTAERQQGGFHQTGDLGFTRDGGLYVTGRKDDLFIVRGRNYYAHDLEAIIGDAAGVKPGRAVVFAVDAAALGTNEAVCLLELQDGASPLDVRRAVKGRVESLSGLVLGRVNVVPTGELHKTTSGKISREENRKAYLAGRFDDRERLHA